MKKTSFYRIERDSMGEVNVSKHALYGAQTQRAIENFKISELEMPRRFIQTLGLVKSACAKANGMLGVLPKDLASAISKAALSVARGEHDNQFPLDIFQTGSGTSTHMNANEVIASLASKDINESIHPNDHVNKGQSSNDVIPTCLHVCAAIEITKKLLPAISLLISSINKKSRQFTRVVKTGRTHLMDATPLTLEQEMSGWAAQLILCETRLKDSLERLYELAIGGTAVGTGINTHPAFKHKVIEQLNQMTGLPFSSKANLFEALSCQDTVVEMSGQLKTLAVALMKISNDLRWMNSGPFSGLAEITLAKLQPGSSIMPGKINPVIPEAVTMVCAQVIGNDTTITVAGQSGNFQLNAMLPILSYNLLQSIEILSTSMTHLATKAIDSFSLNKTKIEENLANNLSVVTALNDLIGYDTGAKIVELAITENKSLLAAAMQLTDLSEDTLMELMDKSKNT